MNCPVCGNPTNPSRSTCEFCNEPLGKRPAKSKNKPLLRTINIKENLPTATEARERMRKEIQSARQAKIRVIKLIHGYGSSGKGGVLRQKLRHSLRKMEKAGEVEHVMIGEEFHLESEDGRFFLKRYPELTSDSDYNHNNPGITLIALS
ncbi:smr domain protein [bacterium BMS3Bbin04]|nr:smr domain protein [bacterium BMS3Bbin04]